MGIGEELVGRHLSPTQAPDLGKMDKGRKEKGSRFYLGRGEVDDDELCASGGGSNLLFRF
jgi:hypothetical protein